MDSNDLLLSGLVIAKVGILKYRNSTQFLSEKELFDEKSLLTYIHKPVTINHPKSPIANSREKIKELGIGKISKIYRDENYLKADLLIFNNCIDLIKEAFECSFELSLGYSLILLDESGIFENQSYDRVQTRRIVDHVALVERSRVGEVTSFNLDSIK